MQTILATIAAIALLIALAWQILGSVWNIIAIVIGLFRDNR